MAPVRTNEPTGSTYEVISAGCSYFEDQVVLDAMGRPRTKDSGAELHVSIRKGARMGEKIVLSDSEAARLLALGAIQKPGERPLPGSGGGTATPFSTPMGDQPAFAPMSMGDPRTASQEARGAEIAGIESRLKEELDEDSAADELDVELATVEELATWIQEDKPNIDVTIGAADSQADLARKLLDAETEATGGNPRAGVVKGLNEIIGEE